MRTPVIVLAALLAAFGSDDGPATVPGITVAAASDLQTVMPRIIELFEKSSGSTARVTFGSSGNFYSQIQNGAPFDVFLSADIDYPRRLDAAGLAEPRSLVTYGVGRMVIWSRRDGPAKVDRGFDSLLERQVRRIAIANPEHAPYGRAAVAALQHANLYEQVRSKLVFGESVSQAAQFVDSG